MNPEGRRFALPRRRRLRRAAEFEAARRGAYSARDPFFAISAVARPGPARLGIAVSRRVSTKAVTRNRIKRQIRESFRLYQAMLQGLDIVVVARSPVAGAANPAIAEALRRLWKRLHQQRCDKS